MKLCVAFLVLCVVQSISAAAEVRVQYPSRQGRKFEPDEIISDRKKVLDALRCIRAEECNLPRKYARMLKESGPSLVVFGRCPPNKCSQEEEHKARDLLHRIANRYPKAFYYTYNIVHRWFP